MSRDARTRLSRATLQQHAAAGLRSPSAPLPSGGGLHADSLLASGNATESVANRVGLSTKNADLSTTYDVAKGAYANASSAASGAYDTASSYASGALDTLSSAIPTGALGGGGLRLPDEALSALGDLW